MQVGWWVGLAEGESDPYGRIINISPSYGKFIAKGYTARQELVNHRLLLVTFSLILVDQWILILVLLSDNWLIQLQAFHCLKYFYAKILMGIINRLIILQSMMMS